MVAIWIVSGLFALAFAVIISGGLLRRLLNRAYHGRLRARAARAVRERGREPLLAEVTVELEALREEQRDVDARLEGNRLGHLILRRQKLFGMVCRLEDWRSAVERS